MTRYAPMAPRNIWRVSERKVAIRNRVGHHAGQSSGESGFRVWFDDPDDNYLECSEGQRPDGAHCWVRAHCDARNQSNTRRPANGLW
jgi:hypothetical protein